MTSKLEVFFDSDVIISSLISDKGAAQRAIFVGLCPAGAAYLLLNTTAIAIGPIISDFQQKELTVVAKRLNLDLHKLNNLLEKKLLVTKIKNSRLEINKHYLRYVLDPNDAHIVAGIATSKPRFFISYNLKHFRIDKIKTDFKAISLTPAQILQYLRLRSNISQSFLK